MDAFSTSGDSPKRIEAVGESNRTAVCFGPWKWIERVSPNSSGYASLAVSNAGGYVPFSIVAGASTQFGSGAMALTGISHCADGVKDSAWPLYLETVLDPSTKAASSFAEFTVCNGLKNVAETNPYAGNGDGDKTVVGGLRIGNGKLAGGGSPARVEKSSFGLDFINTGIKDQGFLTGINFSDDSIAFRADGTRQAIAIASGLSIAWHAGNGWLGPMITSYVDAPKSGMRITFINNGVFLCKNTGEGLLGWDSTGTMSVNGHTEKLYAFPPKADCISHEPLGPYLGKVKVDLGGTIGYIPVYG